MQYIINMNTVQRLDDYTIKKLISSLFSTLIILGSICSIIYINRYLEFKEQLSKQTIQIHSHLWINGKKVDCNDYMKKCSITCEEDNYRTGDCYYDEFGVTSIIYLTVIAIIILLLDFSKFSMKTYRHQYLVIKDESETSSTGGQEYTSLKCAV